MTRRADAHRALHLGSKVDALKPRKCLGIAHKAEIVDGDHGGARCEQRADVDGPMQQIQVLGLRQDRQSKLLPQNAGGWALSVPAPAAPYGEGAGCFKRHVGHERGQLQVRSDGW